jgi:pimeloyl-ACP methyl ester carboxylesterase
VNTVLSADGTPLAYQRSGDGPPVILVGGSFHDARSAAALAQALASRMTVVAFDRRGRGGSGDTPPYEVAREVEDIAALIAGVGGQACVCGFSSGAILGFEAAEAGLPIPKLAMFEPPFRLPAGPQLPPGYLAQMIALTSAGRNADVIEYFMIHAMGLPAGAVTQMRRAPAWAAMAALAPSAVYDGILVGDGSLPAARLAALTVPTLVLDSTASPPWLRNASAATAGAIPGAARLSLDGTFHDIPPDTLAPALAGFFLS